MEETIFRKKSVDRISSPEELDKYLKVTSPTVWLLLVGIIVILCGIIVWGNVGKIETKMTTGCIVEKGSISCLVPEEKIASVKEGMKIRIDDDEYQISAVSSEAFLVSSFNSDFLMHLLDAEADSFAYKATGSADLKDGIYKGEIVTETISPIKFVFN